MKTIFLRDLYDAFDLPGEGPSPVPHVIADNRYGYALRLESGGEQIEVTDDAGGRLRFRTIEQVLDVLADAPAIQPVVGLHFDAWRPTTAVY